MIEKEKAVLLDDSEMVEVEQALRRILAEAGLSWVIAQVDEEYREGVTEDTSTHVLNDSSVEQTDSVVKRLPFERNITSFAYHEGNKRKVLTSRPPSPRERVEALLNAFEKVAVELPEVKGEALRTLVDNTSEMPRADSVAFFADNQPESDGLSLRAVSNMEARENIATALTRLREEIGIEQR